MTLKELVEQAQKMLDGGVPPDAIVYTDSCYDCDCIGPADGLVASTTYRGTVGPDGKEIVLASVLVSR